MQLRKHRQWRGLFADDRGSVTVEAALALTSLVIVCAGMVAAIATLAAQVAAVDAAGAAARSHAIGVIYHPPRGDIRLSTSAGLVTATAEVPGVVGTMRATAVFPVETPEARE
ncbi:hypothetical protein [Corynebacterium halotolerans]|uniref:hypothetical protein n=1 Tax=Corynebacterium halotolerans TaxID=225326 RepID=UPI003CEA8CAF